ncbi:hypothetical protein [Hymenobacter defluvii]|uniref:Uncharacterized protein n=1 Tax=Hymenobacter defluvii TaxID=2054411 RepID=A0ABS3THH3_9BACT|nr:hypothetical protein [Hymenobacter defluvii]MBO3273110.1 hypothetical protein [Hymenobacter defluvii]
MSPSKDPAAQRRITYDLGSKADAAPPTADSLLVSMRKDNTPGTVYHVVAARQVKSTKYPHRYALTVVRAPDLLADVVIRRRRILIRGKQAFPLYWYSRTRKPRP